MLDPKLVLYWACSRAGVSSPAFVLILVAVTCTGGWNLSVTPEALSNQVNLLHIKLEASAKVETQLGSSTVDPFRLHRIFTAT